MHRTSTKERKLLPLAGIVLGAALAAGTAPAQAAITGPLAKTVEQGKQIFMHDTFGGRGMTCASCHQAGGTGPTQVPGMDRKGPSLTNAAAVFPRYKARVNKVVTLEDQIRGCIGGALGGKAPAYDSDTMRALVTYVSSLAQGQRVNLGGAFK